MNELSKLPEQVKEKVLREVSVPRILDALSEIKNVTIREVVQVEFPRVGKSRMEEFMTFAPTKPIFTFSYIDFEDFFNSENMDTKVEPIRVEFDYFDCLELLRMHYEILDTKK